MSRDTNQNLYAEEIITESPYYYDENGRLRVRVLQEEVASLPNYDEEEQKKKQDQTAEIRTLPAKLPSEPVSKGSDAEPAPKAAVEPAAPAPAAPTAAPRKMMAGVAGKLGKLGMRGQIGGGLGKIGGGMRGKVGGRMQDDMRDPTLQPTKPTGDMMAGRAGRAADKMGGKPGRIMSINKPRGGLNVNPKPVRPDSSANMYQSSNTEAPAAADAATADVPQRQMMKQAVKSDLRSLKMQKREMKASGGQVSQGMRDKIVAAKGKLANIKAKPTARPMPQRPNRGRF